MIDQIRPAQLAQWLAQPRTAGVQPLVLDVREPQELRLAGVQADGFALECIPMSVLGARWQELDSERPTACLCHHGARSMQVAAFLKQRGFAQVVNIAGGIDAWACEVDARVPRY